MNILRLGSRGPQVQLLQLALRRAGTYSGATDGIFGAQTKAALTAFQRKNGLPPDGIAGERSHAKLDPYYCGYVIHRLRPGESFYRLSLIYGSSLQAIAAANPKLEAEALRPGTRVVVPLNFPVVPTDIDYCSQLVAFCCRGLAARYPFIERGSMGRSAMGKPLHILELGRGDNRVFYSAAHHANEWITTPLLLRFCERLAAAAAAGGDIFGIPAAELLESSRLSLAPAVDPDGMDLVTGALTGGTYYENAGKIAGDYPDIPFPSGWKANIEGVDLNLQYPAEWEQARSIKFAQGFTGPAPRDYVGEAPLCAPEAMAVYRHSLIFYPDLIMAFHSQGETIFWKFMDYEPEGSREIAVALGDASGYLVEETPYGSGFAGYKDWFIQNYNRPGYTVEVGLGRNPLPLSQFDRIYRDNEGIMTLGISLSAELKQN